MKVTHSLYRLVNTSTLCIVFGVPLLLCAQNKMYAQEQRDEAKPQQEQEARPEATKPARDDMKQDDMKQNEDKDKPARQDQAKPAEQSEDKPAKEERPAHSNDRPVQQNDKSAQQMNRGGQTGDQAQNSGRGRIPDDKFRASFGRQHSFRVQRPTIVQGRSQFQYGGFAFFFQDAWPAGWAYTDDCYIDYIDGEYFLFDLAHPGVRIAIVVIS